MTEPEEYRYGRCPNCGRRTEEEDHCLVECACGWTNQPEPEGEEEGDDER